jgi:Na+/proline symporter
MPIGLVGLLIAAILAAAMSTIAGELSALSTASVIDFYKRFVRAEASDAHFLRVSRVATGFWGLFASGVAVWAVSLGSLIEVVNRFGSYFYGSILGVFILAIAGKRTTSHGVGVVRRHLHASRLPLAQRDRRRGGCGDRRRRERDRAGRVARGSSLTDHRARARRPPRRPRPWRGVGLQRAAAR